nr:probable tRNA N6-adenosine threonylcarbamoyltransferase, mitochondrial isoform X3 [Zootoca vivipara]
MFLKQFLCRYACLQKSFAVRGFGGAISKPPEPCWIDGLRGVSVCRGKCFSTKIVLGIETSCDDTAAAVVDEAGNILGEALHSQSAVHLNTGGIIPSVARQLHQENIASVVQEALAVSRVSTDGLSAIATTVKPGLALSLGVGLAYSLELVEKCKKPFIPIHHMEAHALTVRLTNRVDFPFLVARRLSLRKHPECSGLSGGKAIERLAQQGNRRRHEFKVPMEQHHNCNFSFAGLQSQVTRAIAEEEKAEGRQEGELLSCIPDLAAAVQHTVTAHIIARTHRAIHFCRRKGILPQKKATLVASGGVASNQYIRKALQVLTEATDFTLVCPPPRLCTDNGVMIAWNGIERLCAGLGVLYCTEGIRYEPKALLGTDISEEVQKASIKMPAPDQM